MLAAAGMNLCEWMSNSTEFIHCIPVEDKGPSSECSVLGLTWDLVQDCLSINHSLCTKLELPNTVATKIRQG